MRRVRRKISLDGVPLDGRTLHGGSPEEELENEQTQDRNSTVTIGGVLYRAGRQIFGYACLQIMVCVPPEA